MKTFRLQVISQRLRGALMLNLTMTRNAGLPHFFSLLLDITLIVVFEQGYDSIGNETVFYRSSSERVLQGQS